MPTTMPLRLLASAAVLVFLAGCGDGGSAGAPKPPAAGTPKPPAATSSAAPAGDATEAAGVDSSAWTVSTAESNAKVAEVGGLVFPKPPTWIWTSPRVRFRTLQYDVPGVEGGAGAAELVFSLFMGGDGGPTDMNIDRWVGQFRDAVGGPADATTSTEERGGLVIHRVETAGQYQAMGQPAPRPGQMQLGAIVEAPGRRVFVRLVGPDATVEAAREDFDALVAGVMPAG
jgi:hypothetical protein